MIEKGQTEREQRIFCQILSNQYDSFESFDIRIHRFIEFIEFRVLSTRFTNAESDHF